MPAFGDSLTFGTGAPPGSAWPVTLGRRLPTLRVIGAGVPGATAVDSAQRLAGALEEHRPVGVLLGLGGNDFLRRMPLEDTRAALAAMIGRCRAAGARVMLIAVPQPTLLSAVADSLSDHPVFAELARVERIDLLEQAWSTVLSDPALRSDPIHANERGYARFAELVEAQLRRAGWI